MSIPDVRDFGAVPGDPAFDNGPAFDAAMAAERTLWMPGDYYFASTLHLRTRVYFMGAGMGDENKPAGTILRFPADCDGLRIHSSLDESSSDANHTFLSNLNVAGTAGDTGHGVHSSARIYMQNVCITSFGGDGLHLDGRGTGYGATSHSQFWNVRSGRNNGYGFHSVGSDACNMFFAGCEAVVNHLHGVFDESSVGNTYESMHFEANGINASGSPVNGLTWTDVKNLNTGLNAAYFASCYAESPSLNELYFPGKVDGGLLAQAAYTATSTAPVFNSNRLVNTSLMSTNANGGSQLEMTLGTQGVGNHALGISGSDGTHLDRWELDWEPSIRKLVWRRNGAGPWSMALPMSGDDRMQFPSGVSMTGIDEHPVYGTYALFGFATAVPTTAMPGAVLFKRGRNAGDPIGWSCRSDGTWEPFG